MSRRCRVLKTGLCEITQGYSKSHGGVDLVGANYTLAWEIAHSDGIVVDLVNNCNYNTYPKGPVIYGNYVKLKHDDGYYTLYGHIAYNTIKVKKGDRVKKGDILGYMGNTGYSTGGHLHFEVRNKNDEKIDPIPYLDSNLPENIRPTLKYKLGDIVKINKVYVSSESVNPLNPLITEGKITRIIESARNPYLLDDGKIGWINDNCIVKEISEEHIFKYVTNCYWLNLRKSPSYGDNIYKAVKVGTKVEYLGLDNGWAKIKYDDKILYCGNGYLR